ncbi:MAG: hypothetical protein HY657_02900 [Acidobacteria bacterium]|nr:hypothetical protein [Acidobacteriota bacterium]
MRPKLIFLIAVLLSGTALTLRGLAANGIAASTAPLDEGRMTPAGGDPVVELNRALRTGRATLGFGPRHGYLPSVLDLLGVPRASQVVTFSQASLHGPLISDMYPRAIFFNDDVAVAWVPGAPTIEVAAYSPARGPVFYTLAQSTRQIPQFEEDAACLACHQSPRTLDVPGLLVLSSPIGSSTGVVTDHRTPLRERWGSWYVTGLSRRWRHDGNRLGQGWLVSLYDQFDTRGYPALYSDIVALMVLEHQTRLTNLITRAAAAYRTPEIVPFSMSETVAELVDYMLFVDEAEIPERIIGTSGYAEWFSARAPTDAMGRSLYQLDLKNRLFQHPLSYMIYSRAFEALPEAVKAEVYARIAEVLSGANPSRYRHLTHEDRQALLEILDATKPEFAAYRPTRRDASRLAVALVAGINAEKGRLPTPAGGPGSSSRSIAPRPDRPRTGRW